MQEICTGGGGLDTSQSERNTKRSEIIYFHSRVLEIKHRTDNKNRVHLVALAMYEQLSTAGRNVSLWAALLYVQYTHTHTHKHTLSLFAT
jgi:hypothetical protein